jgi:hypothetical protein
LFPLAVFDRSPSHIDRGERRVIAAFAAASGTPRDEESAMEVGLSRRGFIQIGAAGSLSLVAGCGTILYPERRYQPHGDVDLKVVALDTLGLLLFFIPGVIAFAVDYTTGAIYLPPNPGYGGDARPAKDQPLVAVKVPQKELTQQRLEEVPSHHAGRDVRLVAGEYDTAQLAKLDDFWSTRERLAASRL